MIHPFFIPLNFFTPTSKLFLNALWSFDLLLLDGFIWRFLRCIPRTGRSCSEAYRNVAIGALELVVEPIAAAFLVENV